MDAYNIWLLAYLNTLDPLEIFPVKLFTVENLLYKLKTI